MRTRSAARRSTAPEPVAANSTATSPCSKDVGCDGPDRTSPNAQWRKVLWREQPFGDNYTDESFLESLIVNARVPQRDYWTVAKGSAAIIQQVSTATASVIASVELHEGLLSSLTLLALNGALLLLLSLVCLASGERLPGGSLRRAARQVTLLTTGVFLLSPLYGTLTKTISTDSIVTLVAGCLLLHLYFYDYNFVNGLAERLSGGVSLGAAVCAAVLVASRLQDDLQVFSHLLFSLQLFLLSPYLRRHVRRMSGAAHLLVTLLLCGVSSALLARLSPLLAALHVALNAFIAFAAPAWLLRIHKFKAKINGPWDEAVPKVSLDPHAS